MKKKNVAFGLILTLALFLAAIAGILLFMVPQKSQIRQQKDQLAALNLKIKQDIPESLIQRVETQRDSLSRSLGEKRNRIFPMADLIHLGPAVQSMIKPYELSLVALKPEYDSLSTLEADTSEICPLPLTLVVKGKFAAFAKFANNLTGLPYAVRADEFFINRPDSKTGLLNIEIKGVIFLRKAGVKDADHEEPNSAAAEKM